MVEGFGWREGEFSKYPFQTNNGLSILPHLVRAGAKASLVEKFDRKMSLLTTRRSSGRLSRKLS